MRCNDIIRKLGKEFDKGIETEAQTVYVLAGVRKLLEQQQAGKQYEYLKFHCDWTLHSMLDGTAAQRVLKQFDAASIQLRAGVKLRDFPSGLKKEVYGISKMEYFEDELRAFLLANGLPDLEQIRTDGWTHFLHLYTLAIEDCPLVIKSKKHTTVGLDRVTVHLKVGEPMGEDIPYKIYWTMLNKDGRSNGFYILNSFQLTNAVL